MSALSHGHTCQVCGETFPSRTRLFAHLKTLKRDGTLSVCNEHAKSGGMDLIMPVEDRRHVVFFYGYRQYDPTHPAAQLLWDAINELYGPTASSGKGKRTLAEGCSLPAGVCHTTPSSCAEVVDLDLFAVTLSQIPNFRADMSKEFFNVVQANISRLLPSNVKLFGVDFAPPWFRADARYARLCIGIMMPLSLILSPDIAKDVSPAEIISTIQLRQASRDNNQKSRLQPGITGSVPAKDCGNNDNSLQKITSSLFRRLKRVLKLFHTKGVCEYASFCERGLPGKGGSTLHEVQNFRALGGMPCIGGDHFVSIQMTLGRCIPKGLVERIGGLVVAVMQEKLPEEAIPMLLGKFTGPVPQLVCNLPSIPRECLYFSGILYPNGFFSQEMNRFDSSVKEFSSLSREISAQRINSAVSNWISDSSERGLSYQAERVRCQLFNPLSSLIRAPRPYGKPPMEYMKALGCLREIVSKGLWPNTSEQRRKVIVEDSGSARGGGSFSLGRMLGSEHKCKYNDLFPDLHAAVFALERALMPGRAPSTAVAVNRNATFKPHLDSGAGQGQGVSLIVGLGEYTGGELMVEGMPHDILYRPLEFDGWKERHWTLPFKGERYSLVWFTPQAC